MQFTVTCHGSDPLNLRETLERFANEQWLPTHVTREDSRRLCSISSSAAVVKVFTQSKLLRGIVLREINNG